MLASREHQVLFGIFIAPYEQVPATTNSENEGLSYAQQVKQTTCKF
jgi:hypothetical protein